jgi:hypothetical protein
MYPVILCIAKLESNYIEEFVKYHIALGFDRIFIYDNEDIPTYETLLSNYKQYITVIHFPGIRLQHYAYQHFIDNYLFLSDITHVATIDVDEFIVLKQHLNIKDFINEFIVGDCEGIGMNWRFFGSSDLIEPSNIPSTIRFTKCDRYGDKHIKTIYKKDNLISYYTTHAVVLKSGHIKNTKGDIIQGPFNYNIDLNYIQLNHYKCKTLQEYRYIRTRGQAEGFVKPDYNVDIDFKLYNINDTYDLTAYNFYKKIDNNYIHLD